MVVAASDLIVGRGDSDEGMLSDSPPLAAVEGVINLSSPAAAAAVTPGDEEEPASAKVSAVASPSSTCVLSTVTSG